MPIAFSRRARRWMWVCVGTLPAALAVLCSGCGQQDEPLTAERSKYEAGEESAAAAPAARDLASPSSAPSTALAKSDTPPPARPANRPQASDAAAAPAQRNAPVADVEAPPKPPVLSRQQLEADRFEVPDGTPEELWAFIEDVSAREPRGVTQQQLVDEATRILQARITAAERILAHPDASEKLRRQSVEVKLVSLQDLISQLGVSEAREHLFNFCRALTQDKDPQLAALGRMLSFSLDVGQLVEGKTKDPQPVVAEALRIASEEPKNEETFQHLRSAALELIQAGYKNEGAQIVKKVVAEFAAVKLPRLQQQLESLREQAHFLELDLPQKLTAFMQEQPETLAPLQQAARAMLTQPQLGATTLEHAEFIGGALERQGKSEAARELYAQVDSAYESSEKPELARRAREIVGWAERRMALLGKPLPLEGQLSDGAKLNWGEFQKGKVVLVTFWSTNNREYLEREVPRLKELRDLYHQQGFEILGVNVDQDAELLRRFFDVQPLPWLTLMDGTAGDRKLVDRFGVRSIPFNILVARDGTVAALHMNAHTLPEQLPTLLGARPAERAPATDQSRVIRPAALPAAFVGAADDAPARPTADSDATAGEPPATDATAKKNGDNGGAAAPVDDQPNPYLAAADASRQQLVDFLLAMEEKPQTIRARPGFDEALIEAADRVLADGNQDTLGAVALQIKLETLHRLASSAEGDTKQADQRLWTFLATVKDDARPKIARLTRFLALEKEVLTVDELPLEKVPELLERLAAFYADETLDGRHLRMASATIHAINRLAVESREPHFQQFGKLFAQSKDRDLARYGRRVAQLSAAPNVELVGRELQLPGTTVLGVDFDWNAYRGKVVVVDFWATWCGPCRQEAPLLKALYEKYHEQGLDVVGVSLDTDAEALAKYLEEEEVPWTTLSGEQNQRTAEMYGIRGIPTLLLVAPDGKVAAVAHHSADLIEKLETLLPKP